MINEQSVIRAREDLTVADLGGEAVILDVNSGMYFGLNEVGARIFQLAHQPKPVKQVLQELAREYEVSYEDLKRDVLVFLESMIEQQIVQITDDVTA